MRPTRRRREHGQVLVIVAVMSIVVFGAAALAVDLSVQTHNRRNLQNWTDSAALAGARDLSTNTTTAVQDALQVVLQNSPWSSTSSWASTAPLSSCTSSTCVLTNYAGPSGFTNYSVSISSPPANPLNSAYSSNSYVEVDVSETINNSLAGVLQQRHSTEAGHSIAYSSGPAQPGAAFDYALWVAESGDEGNHQEDVQGNMYVGDASGASATGHGAICVDFAPGSTTDGGHIIYGSPQPWVDESTEPAGPFGYVTPDTVYYSSPSASCSGFGHGSIEAAAAAGNCLSGSTWNTTYQLCIANPPIPVANLQGPTMSGTNYHANQTCIDASSGLAPGIYDVVNSGSCGTGYDIYVGGAATLNCVTFVMENNTTMDVYHTKGTVTITPWGPGCPGFTPASPVDPNDGKYAIYAPPGSSASLLVEKNGTVLNITGTLYMPSGHFTIDQNANMNVTGQAIFNDMADQNGNHPSWNVAYNANDVALTPATPSVLRLVE